MSKGGKTVTQEMTDIRMSDKQTTPLSAVILTKNEERYIGRCLSSLAWADEILVIDAESTDRTRDICLDPSQPWHSKMRLLIEPWKGFQVQRNLALKTAQHDWILVVDADEACSPELAAKIQSLLDKKGEPATKAYKIRRTEYFLGKPIEYGIWNPSYQDRFFNRKGVTYVNNIHEYPIFPTAPDRIHEPLLHAPDFTPERFLEKMNYYTSIEARDRVEKGQRTHLIHLLGAFPAMFLKNYFYYGAYKDGAHGLIISLLEGVSRVVRHIKIWQYSREKQKK
jgi:(heptosyl)LPS beta-1,4-glucosyltransferase